MRRVRAAFIGFLLADVFMLLVAQGPTWVYPKNTSLFLNSNRSGVCDRVTNLNATSTTGDNVTFTVVNQEPFVGFKVVQDQTSQEYILQCSVEKIEDTTYIVEIRANYTSGSSNYTDLTLNITFAKPEPDSLPVAQGPIWVYPKNTSLFLNSNRSGVCDRVTNLNATSTTGDNVTFTVVNQEPFVGFKVVQDQTSQEYILQCSVEKIEDTTYIVEIRANYTSGSSNYTDLTLNITFAKSEPDEDDCASAPCKNGGTCTDLIAEYSCTCRPGFNGTNCEINIDECAADPCKNGGTCNDLDDGYNCSCETGFDGTNCETNINQCVAAPCKNGGNCKNIIGGYTCVCQPGFTGSTCETINGGFSQWNDWSVCSVTCGQGIQIRNRQCDNPAPAGGGMNCPNDGYEERKPCNRNECQVNPAGLCECHSDNYWDGKTCVAKSSICSDSCDTSALVVMVVLLTIVVVFLVIYAVYLRLKMKRNSGRLGIVAKETPVRTKSQEPKFVNDAYVEDETLPFGQLEIQAQNEDVRTPDEIELDKDYESKAADDRNQIPKRSDGAFDVDENLPVVQSVIPAKHENVEALDESDQDEESDDSNGSKDDGQNPRNVICAFDEDGKHPEEKSEIQDQHKDVQAQENEEIEVINTSENEGKTWSDERTEDKGNKEKNNVPDESEIKNETQNESIKSATDDKDKKESTSKSSETNDEDK